jgi:predicted nucleic acid binding AN1-type Zn finger protein
MDCSANIHFCAFCNKKIKLIPFSCKCNLEFCIKHKNPEDHDCKFDFKELGKKIIKTNNPIIKSSKF